MLGILGIQVILEEDKSDKTDRPNVLVANYASVLDHFVIDVVINNIVVSKVGPSLIITILIHGNLFLRWFILRWFPI